MSYIAGSSARESKVRVKWLMILRATVVTVLLGSLAVFHLFQEREPSQAIYLLIAATYLLTLVYSVLYNRVNNYIAFAYVQIAGDVLLETGVVYATGGLDSAFSFTYIISVIAAGIILFRRGSFIIASLAGIAYGTLADLQFYGMILSEPMKEYTQSELFYNIFLNFVAFYSVAFLASSLSERLRVTREALEEKSVDFQELQALNESIVRSMADGMVTVGLDGRITALNKAAVDITGLSFEKVRGRPFSEVFDWVGIETFFEDAAAMTSWPYRSELTLKSGGRDLVIGMTVSPLRNEDGEVTGLLAIFQDLTPIKQMEERMKRKDRLAAIGELSASIAHEIRNPLASLSGSLQVLRGELTLSSENANLMSIALGEMDRLNNIVTEFLTYARPQPPDKESCDLAEIIRQTGQLVVKGKVIRDGIELTTDLPEYPLWLTADPDQMKQVLLNLCLNSVQAMDGSGRLTIRAAEGGGGRLLIEVEDDGAGIDRDDIDRVFYPFYSTKQGGTGLGLSIVYRIVEDHGGTIDVKSGPGRGTLVSILLPKEGA